MDAGVFAMTRDILPPRYVNTSVDVLKASKSNHAAFYTYAVLRGLAWGERTLVIDKRMQEILKNEFGITKPTFYRHLHWLASAEIHAILRYGSASGYTQVEFVVEGEESLKNDSLKNEKRLLTTTPVNPPDEINVVVEESLKNDTGVSKMITPMFDTSLIEAERLFTQITGQVSFPAAWKEEYKRALADILCDQFAGDIARATESGKPVFVRYCGTRSKGGTTYTRTGSGWVDWWQAELAPKPEESEPPQAVDLEALKAKARKEFANANA